MVTNMVSFQNRRTASGLERFFEILALFSIMVSAVNAASAVTSYATNCANVDEKNSMCRRISPSEMAEKIGVQGFPSSGPDQYTGYMTSEQAPEEHFFWWLSPTTRNEHHSAPLIVWFNGGPGCSSLGMGGFFQGNGPVMFNDSNAFIYNRNSWTDIANVLYVDYPIGSGLSFSSKDNPSTWADDKAHYNRLADALTGILTRDPILAAYSGSIVLAGESYGAVYVTMLAEALVAMQGPLAERLSAVLLSAPQVRVGSDYCAQAQYVHLSGMSMAHTNAISESCSSVNQTMVDAFIKGDANEFIPACMAVRPSAGRCFTLLRDSVAYLLKADPEPINPYNSNLKCINPNSNPPCYDMAPLGEKVSKILSSIRPQKVTSAMRYKQPRKWANCSDIKGYKISQSIVDNISSLIQKKVSIFVMSGEKDSIKSFVGTESGLEQAWEQRGEQGGRSAIFTWKSGMLRTWGARKGETNIMMITISEGGHLLSVDAPEATREVLQAILGNGKRALPGVQKVSGKTHLYEVYAQSKKMTPTNVV